MLFPAGAGINRIEHQSARVGGTVPRRRGDQPALTPAVIAGQRSAPKRLVSTPGDHRHSLCIILSASSAPITLAYIKKTPVVTRRLVTEKESLLSPKFVNVMLGQELTKGVVHARLPARA